jgi:mannose/fructose-specific phosphotransferase system component IIA
MSEQAAAARGIVVGHGDMATGLVDAVRQITGEEEALMPVSNRGLTPDALVGRILGLIDGPTIVFTDLQTGSCGIAARRCILQGERVPVIAGVNLPLLLDFVTHRELPVTDLIERLLAHGRQGIQLITPPDAGHGSRSAADR